MRQLSGGSTVNIFRVAGPDGTVDIFDDRVRISDADGELRALPTPDVVTALFQAASRYSV